MGECLTCKQSAEIRNEKLNAARMQAKIKANEQGKTMAIVKKGCNYFVLSARPGIDATEFISKHYDTTAVTVH